MQQAHIESCLASSLRGLLLAQKGIELTEEDEIFILNKGSNYYKVDFSLGQLIYVAQKYKLKFEVMIESKIYYDYLLQQNLPKELELKYGEINNKNLKNYLKNSPIIVYLDKYYTIAKKDLINKYHYPHYVILTDLSKEAEIIDPWDGKIKAYKNTYIVKAIKELRKRLYISSKIIKLI